MAAGGDDGKESASRLNFFSYRILPRFKIAEESCLNSGPKILTTSVFRFQEFAIDSLKDGLLFLTEGNHAGDLETVLSVS